METKATVDETRNQGKADAGEYYSTGSSTSFVYTVEAKTNMAPIRATNGMLVDGQWRQVHFPASEFGTGVKVDMFDKAPLGHGYLSYEAAMALAWTFVANSQRFMLEVRLVEHCFESTYKVKRTGTEVDLNTRGSMSGIATITKK